MRFVLPDWMRLSRDDSTDGAHPEDLPRDVLNALQGMTVSVRSVDPDEGVRAVVLLPGCGFSSADKATATFARLWPALTPTQLARCTRAVKSAVAAQAKAQGHGRRRNWVMDHMNQEG